MVAARLSVPAVIVSLPEMAAVKVGVAEIVPTDASTASKPPAIPNTLAWLSSVPVAEIANAPDTFTVLPVPMVAAIDGVVTTVAGFAATETPPSEPASVVARVVLEPAAEIVSEPAVRFTPVPRYAAVAASAVMVLIATPTEMAPAELP